MARAQLPSGLSQLPRRKGQWPQQSHQTTKKWQGQAQEGALPRAKHCLLCPLPSNGSAAHRGWPVVTVTRLPPGPGPTCAPRPPGPASLVTHRCSSPEPHPGFAGTAWHHLILLVPLRAVHSGFLGELVKVAQTHVCGASGNRPPPSSYSPKQHRKLTSEPNRCGDRRGRTGRGEVSRPAVHLAGRGNFGVQTAPSFPTFHLLPAT